MKKNSTTIGVVYTVTHKESGAVYVGVTTNKIEVRKRDHIQKAQKGTGHDFQEAIVTYGPDAFEWEQVDTARLQDRRVLVNHQSQRLAVESKIVPVVFSGDMSKMSKNKHKK